VAATFADWEEIPEDDEAALAAWQTAVWHKLNKDVASREESLRDDESGLTADTLVACRNWLGQRIYKRIADIRVGDRVCSSEDATTVVVGVVTAMGDLETGAIILPELRGRVRAGTWIFNNSVWEIAAATFPEVDEHPVRWYNLYTKSGTFLLEGGWMVRDASDVGLEGLKELVDSVVLDKTPHTV
jgi:hypothetical protein